MKEIRGTNPTNTEPTKPDVITRTVVENNGHKNNRRKEIVGTMSGDPVNIRSLIDQIRAFTPNAKGRLPKRVLSH